MRKFYILFKNSNVIEGEVSCSEEEFVEAFVNPNKANVYSYQIREKQEEKDDGIMIIEELIRQL